MWLSRAAIAGATDAQYWLAEAYLSGEPVKQDIPRQCRCCRHA